MRNKLLGLITLFCSLNIYATEGIEKRTITFAHRDGSPLKMDLYSTPKSPGEHVPCLIFVFGGGFKEGSRDYEYYLPFFEYFSQEGFVVASIDYRLGMKGAKAPGIFNREPLKRSIQWAVEDLFAATRYLVDHAQELNISPQKIIISGSSAGAITVLQADYELKNKEASAQILPPNFSYSGVMSFAGAIYSHKGLPSYPTPPAPTLFFHGSKDRLVPFKSLRLFRTGMFGSKSLVRRFKVQGYPYHFYEMQSMGHDVSEFPLQEYLPEIQQFIHRYILEGRPLQIHTILSDPNRKSEIKRNPKNYYNSPAS